MGIITTSCDRQGEVERVACTLAPALSPKPPQLGWVQEDQLILEHFVDQTCYLSRASQQISVHEALCKYGYGS